MIVVLKLYTFESTAHTKVFVYQRKVMNTNKQTFESTREQTLKDMVELLA